jgi:uncharacterized protein YdeI (YjbR/CyaY-like superfamily)
LKVDPLFFRSPAELRRWFAKHHATGKELEIGFYKKGSGKPSITYAEALDEALCVGWIDGVRRSLDRDRYTNRFTPRRPTSHWSAVNIRRVAALTAEGRMQPAGLAAFARRKQHPAGVYSYERRPDALPGPYGARFRRYKRAWAFFESQPAGYRRTATWWVLSAKREDTRLKRLDALIADAKSGRTLREFLRASMSKKE